MDLQCYPSIVVMDTAVMIPMLSSQVQLVYSGLSLFQPTMGQDNLAGNIEVATFQRILL